MLVRFGEFRCQVEHPRVGEGCASVSLKLPEALQNRTGQSDQPHACSRALPQPERITGIRSSPVGQEVLVLLMLCARSPTLDIASCTFLSTQLFEPACGPTHVRRAAAVASRDPGQRVHFRQGCALDGHVEGGMKPSVIASLTGVRERSVVDADRQVERRCDRWRRLSLTRLTVVSHARDGVHGSERESWLESALQ